MPDIVEYRITPIVFKDGFTVERYRTRSLLGGGYATKEKFDGVLIKHSLQWASEHPDFSEMGVFCFNSEAEAAKALAQSFLNQ